MQRKAVQFSAMQCNSVQCSGMQSFMLPYPLNTSENPLKTEAGEVNQITLSYTRQ